MNVSRPCRTYRQKCCFLHCCVSVSFVRPKWKALTCEGPQRTESDRLTRWLQHSFGHSAPRESLSLFERQDISEPLGIIFCPQTHGFPSVTHTHTRTHARTHARTHTLDRVMIDLILVLIQMYVILYVRHISTRTHGGNCIP